MKLLLIKTGKLLGYTFIAAFIVIGTIALVAYGQGYFYSPETGRITGGGLLYVASQPSNAEILINSRSRGTTTDRIRLPAGTYQVELNRQGYRGWSKNVTINEAVVTHLQYPLLIPNTVTTTLLDDLGEVVFIDQSSNQSHLAVVEERSQRVRLFEAGDFTAAAATFSLPPGLAGFSITDLDWSLDDSHLIVIAKQAEEIHRFVLDVDGSDPPVDLEEAVNHQVGRLVIADSPSSAYGLAGTNLNRYDLSDQTHTLLGRDVTGFDVVEDRVYAVKNDGDSARVVEITGDGTRVIGEHRTGSDYLLWGDEYNEEPYLILQDTTRNQATIYTDIDTETPRTTTLPVGFASEISTSPNGRFVLVRSGADFMTVDLRLGDIHRFKLSSADTRISWYTNFHLLAEVNDELVLVEFDGANLEYLTRAGGYGAYGNSEQGLVFSLRYNQLIDSLQLQRTSLE